MQQANSDDNIPAYRVDGQGPPLVLIMGLGGRKEDWSPQVREFKRYYRVVTFDNRGIDRVRGQQPATIELMARDTIALLDHLGIDRAHILGYSLGGIIAQEIAIHYPQRVKKLILASTVAGSPNVDTITAGMQQALGLKPGAREQSLDGVDMKRVMSRIIRLSFNRPIYRLMIGLFAGFVGERFADTGLISQMQAASTANTLDKLETIQAPTLVLTGAADRLVDPAASRVLAAHIPGARLVLIEGGGHAYAVEKSRQFNRAVLDFLAEGVSQR